ncbi:MAG: phytanoyl-CoA dioxygenase family protein [Alphaproteobacteria bacterium]|nr:phytanoyl-CoA dioxygenase family protein [Alphaproteobacteria bacterium]
MHHDQATAADGDARRDGFTILRGRVRPETLRQLEALLDQEARSLGAPETGRRVGRATAGGDYRRYSNGVDIAHAAVGDLLDDLQLARTLSDVDGRAWLLSQVFVFDLSAGDAGLRWHSDFRSYAFLPATEHAWTAWVPLDPVGPDDQHGGVAVVPTTVYSGTEEAKMFAFTCGALDDMEYIGKVMAGLEGFNALRNLLLDKAAIEPAMQPGDTLLFDRFVFHRSMPLAEGPRRSRRALALRLVPADGEYRPDIHRTQQMLYSAAGVPPHDAPIAHLMGDVAQGERLSGAPGLVPVR